MYVCMYIVGSCFHSDTLNLCIMRWRDDFEKSNMHNKQSRRYMIMSTISQTAQKKKCITTINQSPTI